MPQPNSANEAVKSAAQAVTKRDYLSLASFLEGRDSLQRVHKKATHGEALRTAGEMYENREYVSAYECFKPVYDKVVSDMQRVLARNTEFEANQLAKKQQRSIAAAKENIQNARAHAQQVIDQFDRLLQDLERKSLVRVHIKKAPSAGAAPTTPAEVAAPTTLSSAHETQLGTNMLPSMEVVSGKQRYRKAPYALPEKETLYSVRDKTRGERIIRVVEKSSDGTLIQVETLEDGKASQPPIQLAVDSLSRQAAKGWCSLLIPITESEESLPAASQPAASNATGNVTMRLDIQNFGRCSAAIVRANIRFDTQLIKDVGDGPFRAGQYEQAFLTFEQFAVGFTSAVASSRQAIADGRRALTAEKGKLSGKEIEERKAAFIRSEHLIHSALREFSTILEGLRMYLRAQQG
jgi:hypothetical protein